MSALKSYFLEEMKLSMLGLEHPKPSCFYLSVWQVNRSAAPLLIWRTLLFLGWLCILLASMITYGQSGIFGYWFIYLTHWGLMLNTVTIGLSVAVSARCYYRGPVGAEFSLPWYIKSYWVFYNCALPIALLITVFYWTILFEAGVEEEVDHALDVAIHGLNSVFMLLLLFSSAHPSRLLHLYQPIIFALTYTAFSTIYYLAGGVDPAGNPWVYQVVNWAYPGTTLSLVAITGVLLVFLHFAVVGLAAIRDGISARCIKPSVITHVEEGTPLRTIQTVI